MEGMPGNPPCHKETDRCEHQNQQGNAQILGQHECQCKKNRDHAGEELGKPKQKSVRKLISISNDALHDITAAVAVQIGKRKDLYPSYRTGTDLLDRTECQTVVDQIHDPCAQ